MKKISIGEKSYKTARTISELNMTARQLRLLTGEPTKRTKGMTEAKAQ
jgi:hypothetical protein